MLFNSLEFAIFLPVVFGLYWWVFGKNMRAQNVLLLIASYIFYGWWDYRFLALIALSTVVDFLAGQGMKSTHSNSRRKQWLWVSLIVNLGLLGFFKYFNFFIESFVDAFALIGLDVQSTTLDIILPVGISFYTFQTLSYTIDVYRRKIEPTSDFISFATYVAFFPQLVAGPIERAAHLLPQFGKARRFDYSKSVDGLRQILWGLVKKVVIADTCGEYVDIIFANSANLEGSSLAIGAILFAFQIYGDFSGYSDIAVGTARLLGFDLMQNFANPYFSRDIAEFWRRWHISLSTWFRDYVYIPLGGSRVGRSKRIRNVFIIFLVSGFWHGANWTFIAWGALHAILFIPLLLSNKNRSHLNVVAEGSVFPSLTELLSMMGTFVLTTLAWIFFRADTIGEAFAYFTSLFDVSLIDVPHYSGYRDLVWLVPLVLTFVWVEWIGRRRKYAIEELSNRLKNPALRYAVYFALMAFIFAFAGKDQQFIYFQF
ncbi:MBOAT family O-acyltransferase [Phaeocystidibacter luteus]|uniref:MBOAT family protein n=1 Tax=Phaeocystidibacter luteus TaxID=911197 RepID=A0A6N6RI47_9FLAO|nr:MBOAT family protein [Phaeocystidibacter luteus]KAB2813944.1 MBOAT family protein [Phaeocystidibacter luteus]